jgi:hypothetical protein
MHKIIHCQFAAIVSSVQCARAGLNWQVIDFQEILEIMAVFIHRIDESRYGCFCKLRTFVHKVIHSLITA